MSFEASNKKNEKSVENAISEKRRQIDNLPCVQ